MINYIELSSQLKQYLTIPNNLDELVPKSNSHYWTVQKLSLFLSDEGIRWFSDKGFALQGSAALFRAPANFDSPIHRDEPFAFNFVLQGYGEMQWVEAEGDLEVNTYEYYTYERYKTVSRVNILDKWTGDIALVKSSIFHRIHTMEVDRICLSVRANNRLSFEEAARLLGV
jgi:hypothetical protein